MSRWSFSRSAAGCALCALLACRSEDVVARSTGASGDAGSGGATAGGATAGAAATSAGGGSANAGTGTGGSVNCGAGTPTVSLIRSNNLATEVCTAQIAAQTFTHALCACGDIDVPGELTSAVFDSGGVEVKRGSASVGVNGNYARVGTLGIAGSLRVASAKPIFTAGSVRVDGDLWLAGAATVAGVVAIGRDAWLTQTVTAVGAAVVGRDLHTAPGAKLSPVGTAQVLGSTIDGPFTLVKPCGCDTGQLLDIAQLVSTARTLNDNAALGLDPDALASETAARSEWILPCGRFYLRAIRTSSAIRLHVTGQVALFVDEDVAATSQFALEIDPGAELDWFILGNLTLDSMAQVGDAARPSAVRVYVAGEQPIELSGTDRAAFNLYAPAAPVSVQGTGDVYGSLFVSAISSNQDLLLHYDNAIIRAGGTCAAPADSCARCAQCSAGPDCLANACYDCSTDSDCCAPFVCREQRCESLTYLH